MRGKLKTNPRAASLVVGVMATMFCWACFSSRGFAQDPSSSGKNAPPSAPKSKLRGNELTGGSDAYTSTKVFGIEARGSKFVYVFDRSGSMGEHKNLPLRKAKEELLASIDSLSDQQQFYIIFYNHEPKLFDPGPTPNRLVFATDENKQRAKHFVESISADGGTDHMNALSIAIRLHSDVIFLLTDGEAQDDPTAEDLKRIERLNSGEASIHVIQFAPAPRPDSALIKLAEENRGKHVFVDTNKFSEHSRAGGEGAK